MAYEKCQIFWCYLQGCHKIFALLNLGIEHIIYIQILDLYKEHYTNENLSFNYVPCANLDLIIATQHVGLLENVLY